MTNYKKFLSLAACILVLAGCSSAPSSASEQKQEPIQENSVDADSNETAKSDENKEKATQEKVNPYAGEAIPDKLKWKNSKETLEDGWVADHYYFDMTLDQFGAWIYNNLSDEIQGTPEFKLDDDMSQDGYKTWYISITPDVDIVAQFSDQDNFTGIAVMDYNDTVTDQTKSIVNKLVQATDPGEEKDWASVMMNEGISCDSVNYNITNNATLMYLQVNLPDTDPYFDFAVSPDDFTRSGAKESYEQQLKTCS